MSYLWRNTLATALAAATTLGGVFAAPAQAGSSALSVNDISSFSMTINGGYTLYPFTFSNDAAASEDGGTGGVDALDAPAACVGACGGFNNQFFGHGPAASEFSYGDAKINNTSVLHGNGAASSIGETAVHKGFGYASGSNVMSSGFFLVDPGATIDFLFDSDPFMKTTSTGAGSSAASTFFNISLAQANIPVFSWSPNGQAGGITGGTENADPFSLDYGIGGNSTYDPLLGMFSASTDTLTGGLYTLNITMENQVNAAATVPVPAAVWMFGSGLIALSVISRRRPRNNQA